MASFVAAPSFASELRIGVSNSPMSLPFAVAEQQNFFSKHGVNPLLVKCLGGIRCVKELIENKVDMATSSELPVLFNSFETSNLSILATFSQNNDDLKLIVSKEMADKKPADWEDRRVGVVMKSASQYYVDVALLFHGIDPRAVKFVSLTPEELPKAITSGKVDAVSVWEPYGYLAQKTGKDSVVVLKTPKLYQQNFILTTTKEFSRSNNQKISAVLRALVDANEFIRKHPNQAQQIMVKHSNLDQEFVKGNWSTYRFNLTLQQSLITTIEGEARWMIREQHVDAKSNIPDVSKMIDASHLNRIAPQAIDFAYK
jgi:ABC-type nitrate/sulfonate/bicarbonate transport system substrate-binding protein